MTIDKQVKVGRLAMRQEGEYWKAYYAMPETMEDAIFLGSVKLHLVQDENRQLLFLNLMRGA